jgi:hypothetical protein
MVALWSLGGGLGSEDRDWTGREIPAFRRQVASGVGS